MLTLAEYERVLATQDRGYGTLWLVIAWVMVVGYLALRRWYKTGERVSHFDVFPALSDRTFFTGVVLVAALLRLPPLFRSFWYDEAFTAAIARAPDFWTALAGDVHPPGHYLIVRLASLLLGTSEAAVRFPSFIAGLLLIYVIYRLVLSFTFERQTARLAALLVAVMPAMISYSVEARYPIFLAVAALTAVIAIRENRPALFAFSAAACAYFHATGILYCVLLCMMVPLCRWWWRWSRLWWKWSALALVLIVPCVLLALSQSRDVADGFWLLDSNPLWHIVDMTIERQKPFPALVPLTYAPVMVITIAALWHCRRWLLDPLVAALTALPFITWGISLVWHPIYLSRTLIAPVLLMVMLWAIYLRRSGWHVPAALAFTIAASLPGVYTITPGSDLREIFGRCDGADLVYATSTHVAINALYYAPAPVVVWWGGNGVSQTLPAASRLAMGMTMTSGIDTKLRGDVCVVELVNYLTTQAEYNHIAALEQRYRPRIEVIPFNGLLHYRILRMEI